MKMKFKISELTDSFYETEQEDPSEVIRYHQLHQNILLKTPAGSEINLSYRLRQETPVFSEPNLDLLEKTGKTSLINTEGETKTDEDFVITAKPLDLIHSLNDEEFKTYFKKYYYTPLEKLNTPELQHFYDFKVQQQGYNEMEPPFFLMKEKNKEVIAQFHQNIVEALQKPDIYFNYEVEVPQSLGEEINKLEQQSYINAETNAKSKIREISHEAVRKIEIQNNAIAEQYKADIQEGLKFEASGWKPPKIK